jgi:hypothetical protein
MRSVYYIVRFQILMAASMKMPVFWNVTPFSLEETDRLFNRAYCLYNLDDGPVVESSNL